MMTPEPLTQDDLEQFKGQLQTLYRETAEKTRQALLNSNNEHFSSLADSVHDLEEEAMADLLADTRLEEVHRDIEELRSIDRALRRLGEGKYGECVDCGEAIARERLFVYPQAIRCLECKTRYEREHYQPAPRV